MGYTKGTVMFVYSPPLDRRAKLTVRALKRLHFPYFQNLLTKNLAIIRKFLYLCKCIAAAANVVVTNGWLVEKPKLWCKNLLASRVVSTI